MITVAASPAVPAWVYEGLFPEADEDQLAKLGERWDAQGTALQGRADAVERIFRNLGSTFTGPAADAAGEKSDQVRRFLHSTGAASIELGKACQQSAAIVRFAKTAINVVLLALQVQSVAITVTALGETAKVGASLKLKQLQIVAHLTILAINAAAVAKIGALAPKSEIEPRLVLAKNTTSKFAPGTNGSLYNQTAINNIANETGVKLQSPGSGAPGGSGAPDGEEGPDGPGGPGGETGEGESDIDQNAVDPTTMFDTSAVTGANNEQGEAPTESEIAAIDEATGGVVGLVKGLIDDPTSTGTEIDLSVGVGTGTGEGSGAPPTLPQGWSPLDPDATYGGQPISTDGTPPASGSGGGTDSDGGGLINIDVDTTPGDSEGSGTGVSASIGGKPGTLEVTVTGDTGSSNTGNTGGGSTSSPSGGGSTGGSSGGGSTGGYNGGTTGSTGGGSTAGHGTGGGSHGGSTSSGSTGGSTGSTWTPPPSNSGTSSAGLSGGYGGPTDSGGLPGGAPGGPVGGSLGGPGGGVGGPSGGSGVPLGGGSLGGGLGTGGGIGGPVGGPPVGGPIGGTVGGGPIGGAPGGGLPGGAGVPGGTAVPGGAGVPGGGVPNSGVPGSGVPAAPGNPGNVTGGVTPQPGGQQQPLQQPNANTQPAPGGAVPKNLTAPTIDRPRDPESAPRTDLAGAAPMLALPFAGAGLAPLFRDLRRAMPLPRDVGSGGLVLPTQFGPADVPLALLPVGLGITYQRVLLPGEADALTTGQVTTLRGLLHPLSQVVHLRTPAELHTALGLGFSVSADDGSSQLAFDPAASSVEVLRFAGIRDLDLVVPIAPDVELDTGSTIPAKVRHHGRPWTGGGVAPGSNEDALIEEFEILPAVGQNVPHLAEIWRLHADGTAEHVATHNARTGLWSNSRIAAAPVGAAAPNGHHAVLADGTRYPLTLLNDREVLLLDRSGMAPDSFTVGDDGVARRVVPAAEVTRFLGVVTIGHWQGAAVKVLQRAAGQSLVDYVDDSPDRARELGFRQLGQGQWQQRWVLDSELEGTASWEREYPPFAEPTSIRPVAPAPLSDGANGVPATSAPDVAPDGIGIRA